MSRPSVAQEGIWLGHQRAKDPSIYNAAQLILLESGAQSALLVAAIQTTLAEAEALHINFIESESHEPVIVRRSGFREGAVAEQGSRMQLGEVLALAHERIQKIFDLAAEPLFYHEVIQLEDGRVAWLHMAHHILLDGYGFNLIARRVSEHYGAESRAQGQGQGQRQATSGFTELRHVLEQSLEYQSSHDRAADLEFWREELRDAPGLVWGDSEEPARGIRVRQQLSRELVRALETSATAAGVGWIDLALAAIARVCSDVNGQGQFSLGLPAMLRLGTAALRTPCMAMNIVPLRIATAPSLSRLQLARELRHSQARQRAHQRFRYEHFSREGVAQPAFGPVVNVMPFDFPLSFAGSRAELIEISTGPVMDLAFSLVVRDSAWTLSLEGHPRLFSRHDLVWLLNLVETELNEEAFNLAPRNPEKRSLTVAPARSVCPLKELEAMAVGAASRVALQWRDGTLTYLELLQAVNGCAQALARTGVARGIRVAVDLERSPLAAVVLLALYKLGASYVAVDPAHPEPRRQAVFDRATPQVWVRRTTVDGAPSPRAATKGASERLEVLFECSPAMLEDWARGAAHFPIASDNTNDTAYVTFTSGSSGEPKGVVTSFGALRHFAGAALERYRIVSSDRVLCFAPLTFDASVEELFVSIAAGATLVFRSEEMLDSVRDFLDECAQLRLSVLDLPTSYFHEIALAVSQGGFALPCCLRTVIIGGEAAQADRVRQFLRWAPGVRLINTYGPSEATVVSTSADLSEDTLLENVAPIGRPLAGVSAHVCDSAGNSIAQIGATGELYLSGPLIADGYLGRADLTQERFINMADGQRAYRTGDLVSRGLTGELYFRGRVDNELKISGYRIAPADVEAAIRRYPLVREAVVWGHAGAGKALHLWAAVEALGPLDLQELRDFVGEMLPSAMVPLHWKHAKRFPLTSSGKIDRDRVQREANDENRPTKSMGEELAVTLPGNQTILSQVLDAWREVLGVQHIEADQNFFDLGGSSLHLIQLANRLSQLASQLSKAKTIRVAELFKRATPLSQVEWLESRALSESPDDRLSIKLFSPSPVQIRLRKSDALLTHRSEMEPILLTGVTGFLGIYLLSSLLRLSSVRVVCLVRASSESDGWKRIEDQANAMGLELSTMRARVQVVSVNDAAAVMPQLQSKLLRVSRIVHCAAQVSLTRDYESLLGSNVKLTRDLLEWAGEIGAEFHFVSTVATLPRGAREEIFYENHEGLRDGYQQSKAHAEWLCQSAAEQGLKVAVYRLGRVVGARRRPQVNANDLVWRIARSSARVGLWPNVQVSEPWAPVDELADSLITLSLQESAASPGSVFHLVQHGSVELDQVRQGLVTVGMGLRGVTVSEWTSAVRVQADEEDLATLSFFEMRAADSAEVSSIFPSCERTRARLGSLECEPVSQSFIVRLCESAKESGILPGIPHLHPSQKVPVP